MTNALPSLSILVVTYNRPADMLDLARNIALLGHTDLLSEIIIVNNHSSVPYQEVTDFIAANKHLPFRYFFTEKNMGVSGGRNFAIQKSTGGVLIFLDDDALFQEKDALRQVSHLFSEKKQLGIASFRVLYYSTKQLQKTAFAHKRFNERKNRASFETYYFVGCAHAIRREVFSSAGFYPEDFFYGMEEYDLSYRALQEGFTIIYYAGVTVLHKESPLGRMPNEEKLRGMWVNKSKVAWKYLPKLYFFTTAFLWSFFYLKNAGFNIVGWAKGWKTVANIPPGVNRNVIQKPVRAYLKKVQARLWY